MKTKLIFTFNLLFIISCGVTRNIELVSPVELVSIKYTVKNDNHLHSVFYKINNNGNYTLYKCKDNIMSQINECFQSDSVVLKWLCDSVNLEKFDVKTSLKNERISSLGDEYQYFFKENTIFKNLTMKNNKDTINTKNHEIINIDSLKIDNRNFSFKQIILDSFYVNEFDTIYIFKEEMLTITGNEIYPQDYSTPTIYHISNSMFIYLIAELIGSNIYAPVYEVVYKKKVMCFH